MSLLHSYLFLRALLVAAYAFRSPRKIGRALWFLFTHRMDAPAAVVVQRLLVCHRCALYNPAHYTCGTYRVTVDAEGQQMGCLCYLPVKAAYAKAQCWLDEVGASVIPRWTKPPAKRNNV